MFLWLFRGPRERPRARLETEARCIWTIFRAALSLPRYLAARFAVGPERNTSQRDMFLSVTNRFPSGMVGTLSGAAWERISTR